MAFSALILLVVAHFADAHFSIEYPTGRAVTVGSGRLNESYSQWVQPCAGVPGNLPGGNRTDWPMTGGSLKLDLHHPWTYIFVNLGLGDDVSNFNYSLTNPFWNETGNGTLCVPQIALPTDLPISDGSRGSLQVVTVGDDGNALYNCADITFRANATALSGNECANSTGVSYTVIGSQSQSQPNPTTSPSSSPSPGSGSFNGVSTLVLSSVVAITMSVVFGMSV
ncbi:hypothetical protein N656DRAFT_802742 [Canariomyces notabilis]|uniref:Copper acquisition factor BIM1-like domain-containing protein n=1 Tax=Canariomyces notabilis TaxID=2074819 RepID=A0AAN6QH76_9PEZI|nr:hypothetical protein N656DRAFT_802742 [Canariomyces arenarius]